MLQIWPEHREVDQDALIGLYDTGPGLRVNFVSSLDGAATVDGKSAGLSGPADKRIFGILRMLCDALVVGAGTVRDEGYRALRLDDERREWRKAHGLTEFPTLVIVSGRADLDPEQPALKDAPVRPIVITHGTTDASRLDGVADVIKADLPTAIGELRQRGFTRLLSEGGPRLFGSLAAIDAVDELCLTVSPLLAGPGPERIVTGDPLRTPLNLTLRHVLTAEGQVFLRHGR